MRTLIFFTLLALSLSSGYAQDTDFNKFHSRNTFYLELGGRGIHWSLNYERRYIPTEKIRYGFHLGLSKLIGSLDFGPQPDNSLFFPVSGFMTYGSTQHQVEGGLGVSIATGSGFKASGNTFYPTLEGNVGLIGTGQFGYRFHPHLTGVVIRVMYTPLFFYLNTPSGSDPKLDHWIGVSLGWALRNVNVR